MRVNINQISNGVNQFLRSEVIPHIQDAGTKTVVGAFTFALARNPGMIEAVLKNGIMSTILSADGGMYETDDLFAAVTDSVREFGGLQVTIPQIPLISPATRTLTFGISDIECLKRMVESA